MTGEVPETVFRLPLRHGKGDRMATDTAGWDHLIPGEKWDEWKARVNAQRCTDLVDAGGIGWNIGRCRNRAVADGLCGGCAAFAAKRAA